MPTICIIRTVKEGNEHHLLVGILLYALLGKLADVASRALERRWLCWHPEYR
jgi:ABC-type nitrate/sulfonate/bicarbonate transport system permease component